MKTKYAVIDPSGETIYVVADGCGVVGPGVLLFHDGNELKQAFAVGRWLAVRNEGPYLAEAEVLGPVIGTLHKLNPLPEDAPSTPDAHGHHEVDL